MHVGGLTRGRGLATRWRKLIRWGRRVAGPHGIHRGSGAGVRDSRNEGALSTGALGVDAIGSGGEGGGTRYKLGGHWGATIAGTGHLVALNGSATIRGRGLPADNGAVAGRHSGGP